MTISVGPIEAIWLSLTLIGAGVTFIAYLDALRDRKAARALNGTIEGVVRRIVARGNVRRELVRLAIQSLFLAIALPSVFSTAEIRLTPFLLGLMALPALQLVNTSSDYVDRRHIARKLRAEISTAALKAMAQNDDLA